MITEFVVNMVAGFTGWVGAHLALPDPPAFVSDLPGWVSQAGGYVGSTSAWVPWSLMAAVTAAFVVALSAGLAVKLLRIAASFVTLGGGSAA